MKRLLLILAITSTLFGAVNNEREKLVECKADIVAKYGNVFKDIRKNYAKTVKECEKFEVFLRLDRLKGIDSYKGFVFPISNLLYFKVWDKEKVERKIKENYSFGLAISFLKEKLGSGAKARRKLVYLNLKFARDINQFKKKLPGFEEWLIKNNFEEKEKYVGVLNARLKGVKTNTTLLATEVEERKRDHSDTVVSHGISKPSGLSFITFIVFIVIGIAVWFWVIIIRKGFKTFKNIINKKEDKKD